jgi:pimeloyl-ACP methyl ester carboxylesterase
MGVAGGRSAVLAHCFLGHSGAWPRLLAALRAPLDAVAFDLPGHGRSDPWDGSGDLLATVAVGFDELTEDGALLIGHSFGAAGALRFAVTHPERVAGLVLIEPVFFAAARNEPEFIENEAAEAGLRAAYAAGDMAAAAAEFFALNGDAAGWAGMPAKMRAQVLAQMPMVAASVPGLHHDNAGLLAPGRMAGLRAPVLLLDGALSPPIFGAVNRALARLLLQARRITVPGAGHMLPITHESQTAALIDAWLVETGLAHADRAAPKKPETRAG